MDKELFKFLIADYQRFATEVKLIDRPYHTEAALNYVFVGLRRAGKSYLMFQEIQRYLKAGHSRDEILYFNFEDDRLPLMKSRDLDLIKTCYEEMYACRPIFFLDELQVVEGWEKFARRLADQGYRVYVTGSNAKMLSSEIASTLGGRFMIRHVYPYSFKEFLGAQSMDVSDNNARYLLRAEIIRAFEDYFRFGGLPEVVRLTGKREWLSNLYQKLLFGDLVTRYEIRNAFALRILIRKLAESVKQPISFNRLANVVSSSGKKISTDTVIDYLGYMHEAWLVFSVENHASKMVDKEANKKYYFTDNGLLNLFLLDPNTALLENLVAIRLKQLYDDRLFFYHQGVEVDFFIPDLKLAIQVCYQLDDERTENREVNALLQLAKRVELSKMLIISKDQERSMEISGVKIEVIPVWKWLLS